MGNTSNFNTWASIMVDVYKRNNNGYWAVIMPILVVFRDFLLKNYCNCPSLFLYGPTASGKTEFAKSIGSIFNPNTRVFNLNTTTTSALFHLIENDKGIVVLDEFDDRLLHHTRFNYLKAIVGDSMGRYTIDKNKKVRPMEKNASLILIGQEPTERDDYSLANRTILLPFIQEEWSEKEHKAFLRLKGLERHGLLFQIQKDIAGLEDIIHQDLDNYLISTRIDFLLKFKNRSFDMRCFNSVMFYAAMVRLIEERATQIQLPFKYVDFIDVAIKYIVDRTNVQLKIAKS